MTLSGGQQNFLATLPGVHAAPRLPGEGASALAVTQPAQGQLPSTAYVAPKGSAPREVLKAVDDWLDAHHFQVLPVEVGMALPEADLISLDGRQVGSLLEVRRALEGAQPSLSPYAPDVEERIRARWTEEVRQSRLQRGKVPGVPAPPAEVLKRRRDGHIYWLPNPAFPRTAADQVPPAPADWLEGFFRFYDLDAPEGAEAKGCAFNGSVMAVGEAARFAGDQAALAGYGPNSGAAGMAAGLCAERRKARDEGSVVERLRRKLAKPGPVDEELRILTHMDMPALLKALAQLDADLREALVQRLPGKPDKRLGAALEAVQGNYAALRKDLPHLESLDRQAILEMLPEDVRGGMPKPADSQGPDDPNQKPWGVQGGGAVVQHHYTTAAGANPVLREWLLQVVGSYTHKQHRDKQDGTELQADIQVQYSVTTGQWSVSIGGQRSVVLNLSDDVQVAFWAQLTGGVVLNTQDLQVALAGGGQLVWQPSDWIAFGAQFGGGPVYSEKSPSTNDLSGVIFIQYSR